MRPSCPPEKAIRPSFVPSTLVTAPACRTRQQNRQSAGCESLTKYQPAVEHAVTDAVPGRASSWACLLQHSPCSSKASLQYMRQCSVQLLQGCLSSHPQHCIIYALGAPDARCASVASEWSHQAHAAERKRQLANALLWMPD